MPVGATQDAELVARAERGEQRALARILTLVEEGGERGDELLRQLRPRTGRAAVVGVTGSPGAGKSTLTDALIAHWREAGQTVGVVAIDPSSPFTGGAILGDRIRMTRWYADAGVFIRSLATRGHLGGLSAATLRVAAVLDAFAYDVVVIETVGVGQSEVDVADAADTTVVVLTPGSGDAVQAFKAGIMEVGDVFCVNKADLPGADRVRREVRSALDLAPSPPGAWRPPIVATVASTGEGVPGLAQRIADHRAHLAAAGRLEEARRRRVRAEVLALLGAQLRRAWEERQERAVNDILAGRSTPAAEVRRLWATGA
ncbi:MAG TPA: methylmalonyl Co-A mutase-associated GTPase MeaB [Trueperaceae bacterium]|nr:methylmalonyl Co-A mutase-associated GTPase MeaB [Trueperaceae bacterium]